MTTTVTFGGVPATNVKVVNDKTIICTVPAGTGLVDVTVATDGGADTEAGAFTYIAAPVMSAVSPPTGPEAGGAEVTITGQHFAGSDPVVTPVR